MKRKKWFLFTILFLIIPITLSADDYQKSDSFFGSNNALTPFGNNQADSGFRKDDLFEKKNNYFDGKFEKKSKEKEKEAIKKQEKKIDNFFASEDSEIVSGSKIINIGLVVNAVNKKHFSQVMEKLMTTVDDFDLDSGHVYLNGLTFEKDDYILTPLIARGSSMSYHFTVPEQFNISLSPTWIIQTAEGLILLEGVKNLNRYINKKGEFVENGVPIEQRVSEREDNSFKGGSIFFE